MEKVIFTVTYYTQGGSAKVVYVVAKDFGGAEKAVLHWAESAIPNQFKSIYKIELSNDTKFITEE